MKLGSNKDTTPTGPSNFHRVKGDQCWLTASVVASCVGHPFHAFKNGTENFAAPNALFDEQVGENLVISFSRVIVARN
jgi:hypothetical protein